MRQAILEVLRDAVLAPPSFVASFLGISPQEAGGLLEEMAREGLVFSPGLDGPGPLYALADAALKVLPEGEGLSPREYARRYGLSGERLYRAVVGVERTLAVQPLILGWKEEGLLGGFQAMGKRRFRRRRSFYPLWLDLEAELSTGQGPLQVVVEVDEGLLPMREYAARIRLLWKYMVRLIQAGRRPSLALLAPCISRGQAVVDYITRRVERDYRPFPVYIGAFDPEDLRWHRVGWGRVRLPGLEAR